MKLIDTRTHGVIDYTMGMLLIAGPYLFALGGNRPESDIMYVLGAGAIGYSLLTNYDLGVVKILPMNAHLVLDLFCAITLAVSPWLFGFANRVTLPHLVIGLIGIAAVLATNPDKRGSTRLI